MHVTTGDDIIQLALCTARVNLQRLMHSFHTLKNKFMMTLYKNQTYL